MDEKSDKMRHMQEKLTILIKKVLFPVWPRNIEKELIVLCIIKAEK